MDAVPNRSGRRAGLRPAAAAEQEGDQREQEARVGVQHEPVAVAEPLLHLRVELLWIGDPQPVCEPAWNDLFDLDEALGIEPIRKCASVMRAFASESMT